MIDGMVWGWGMMKVCMSGAFDAYDFLREKSGLGNYLFQRIWCEELSLVCFFSRIWLIFFRMMIQRKSDSHSKVIHQKLPTLFDRYFVAAVRERCAILANEDN